MDINYRLKQRKEDRIKQQKIRFQVQQRKFNAQKKYFDKELDDKIQEDALGNKKQEFYQQLFNQQEDIKQTKTKKKQPKQQEEQTQQKHKKTKKEQKMIKKIYKERTSKGQPIMKNYLNYLVQKIEQSKK